MVTEAFRFITQEDAPQAFEEIDRQAMLNDLVRRIVELNPQIDLTVPQPGMQIVDAVVSYLFNSRQYQNNLRLGTYTRFATGGNLVQRGNEAGLIQGDNESQESFRHRILTTPYVSTLTIAGLQALVIRNFSAEVIPPVIFSYDRTTGVTTFRLLAIQGNNLPTADLNERVREYLSRPENSAEASSFSPANPTITEAYASINIVSREDVESQAIAAIDAYKQRTFALGNTIRQQDIYRALSTIPNAVFTIISLNTVSLTNPALGDIASPGVDVALRLNYQFNVVPVT